MRASWPSEYLILGLLCEQPRHGYELAQFVITDEALRTIWYLKRSEVYFLLEKLLDGGLIGASPETEPAALPRREAASGPPRVIYAPTRAGREAFERWLTTPEKSPRDLRAAFLAKMYLALRREPSLAVTLLAAQRASLQSWRGHLQGCASEDPFLNMARLLRVGQVDAALAALDEMEALIPAGCYGCEAVAA